MEFKNHYNAMKVIDLRNELKSLGLPSTGNKAMLIARLNAVMSQNSHDDHSDDVSLDPVEIDSDGVLEEDGKDQSDNLLDSLNEELALADNPLPLANDPVSAKSPPSHQTLKRKLTTNTVEINDASEGETKDSGIKKVVLNRATSLTLSNSTVETKPDHSTEIKKADTILSSNNEVKITADVDAKSKLELRARRFGLPVKMTDVDAKSKLELRARRFGLPVKMTDEQRKEIRKNRFSQNTSNVLSTDQVPSSLADNLDKLKKRAERFGQSVSKIMIDIENKEKLEKRKAKFGTIK